MSKNTPQKTNRIHLRSLDQKSKEKIRALLRYGDVSKIADRCDFIGYDQVSNVLRGVSNNDRVWKVALEYLNELETTGVSENLAEMIRSEKEVA